MTRIRLLSSFEGPDTSLCHGDILVVPDDITQVTAERMCAGGLAEVLEQDPPGDDPFTACPDYDPAWREPLVAAGISSVADLAAATPAQLDGITAAKGLGKVTAQKLISWAQAQAG